MSAKRQGTHFRPVFPQTDSGLAEALNTETQNDDVRDSRIRKSRSLLLFREAAPIALGDDMVFSVAFAPQIAPLDRINDVAYLAGVNRRIGGGDVGHAAIWEKSYFCVFAV